MSTENNNQGETDVGEHWHLDKKVPLSLIFAMCIQAAMVVWAIADIKKDVEVLKAEQMLQKERDVRQDVRTVEVQKLLLDQLGRIDAKLDRLVEKR